MDALQMLKRDHAKVKEMLADLETTTERAVKTRTDGLATLKQELTVHELIEEEIFYPAMKDSAEAKEIVLEAYEEHDVVDAILGELERTPVQDETWKAKFTVMKENLEHHIDEEEGEMFDQARELFGKQELTELGARMQVRKEKALAEMGVLPSKKSA
ncbi:MAG TPA: hemerythrin domain-containing protein [Actinomycetota bacterium]|nr:hemerythrin domain-containing protein [Actinomycetota bacterium]